jgi:hypothetical protein
VALAHAYFAHLQLNFEAPSHGARMTMALGRLLSCTFRLRHRDRTARKQRKSRAGLAPRMFVVGARHRQGLVRLAAR